MLVWQELLPEPISLSFSEGLAAKPLLVWSLLSVVSHICGSSRPWAVESLGARDQLRYSHSRHIAS